MSQSVKVPDPVYDAIEREAERRDVPRGVVVEGWKRKAEALDEVADQLPAGGAELDPF